MSKMMPLQPGLGFRFQSLGFRVQGSEFRVLGKGLRVSVFPQQQTATQLHIESASIASAEHERTPGSSPQFSIWVQGLRFGADVGAWIIGIWDRNSSYLEVYRDTMQRPK